ncbi:hypothetical protein CEXT_399641 [Caerostris extrusa]|uniref:Uncharacterized protein n=1 Tax=Caerostris extrusa TaxID=172846 RepID=A0AAV4Y2X5_CAEEX|nr:hypothetical protein CEXT_399641 [Caerostris extrusa]
MKRSCSSVDDLPSSQLDLFNLQWKGRKEGMYISLKERSIVIKSSVPSCQETEFIFLTCCHFVYITVILYKFKFVEVYVKCCILRHL